jgi:hypothetical protein
MGISLGAEMELANYVYLVAFAPTLLVTYTFAVRLTRAVEQTGRLQGRSTARLLSGSLILLVMISTAVICGLLDIPLGIDQGADAVDIALTGLISLPVAVALCVATGAVIRALPHRERSGPHLGVNRLLGGITVGTKLLVGAFFLLFAVAVIGSLVELLAGRWGPLGLVEYLALLILPAFLVFLFFYVRRGQRTASSYAKRLLARPAKAAVGKPRVLYLRPFDEEHRLFAGSQALDEFLGDEIAEQIGPLIALGNPMDRIAPDGAERHYFDDAEWQAAVERLATEAPCIVASTSASPNTAWELRRVLELGLERRLYLLSPPRAPEPPAGAPVAPKRGTRKLFGVIRRALFSILAQDFDGVARELSFGELPAAMSPAGQTSWDDFVNTLITCGYAVDIPDPGAGAVVGFETGGRAVLLETGASTPVDFVRPMVDREPAAGHPPIFANNDPPGHDSSTRMAGKRGHRRAGGNVEENLDRPVADWSDEQLLDGYRASTADLSEGADRDGPTKSAITEEILRRGLSLPDMPTAPKSETVDWSGEAGGEDPGSGALPTPF